MLNDYDRYAISGNSEDLVYEDDGSCHRPRRPSPLSYR